ncbi:MAG: hypothetical protein KAX49_11025 [Halanaerobiales bacterium]|nr:hypothetical protein [Halanaerobiales bacterium]
MDKITKKIIKYWAITRVSINNAFTYIGEVVYRSTFMLVLLFIFIKLWGAVYVDNASFEGLSYSQVIWYLVLTESILLSKIKAGNLISNEVITGKLAYTLGKPYHYLLYTFFNGLGESLTRLFIDFAVGSLLVLVLIGPLPAHPLVLLPILLTILLAFILDYCMVSLIGLLAFYTEDVSGFLFIYQKILFILGGLLIPLEFFPNWLQEITHYLPFDLVLYGPAKLLIDFSLDGFLQVVLQQTMWILILGIILEFMYRNGTRRLCVNGG